MQSINLLYYFRRLYSTIQHQFPSRRWSYINRRRCYKCIWLTFFSPPPGLCCALSRDPTFEV